MCVYIHIRLTGGLWRVRMNSCPEKVNDMPPYSACQHIACQQAKFSLSAKELILTVLLLQKFSYLVESRSHDQMNKKE